MVSPSSKVAVTPVASWVRPAQGLGPYHLAAQFVQALQQQPLGVGLGEHQRVRVLGRQLAEVDGHQDAWSFPHGESRRDQPGLDHSAGHVEVFEHLQGAGVHGGRAGGVLALRQLVDHDRPVPAGDQGGGQREAGGAGAYHQDVGVVHGWLLSSG